MTKVLLCILDGMGYRKEKKGNAFLNAATPNFDYLWSNYPHSLLEASGNAVGLPIGQMGNSEVGHTNIGAGRITYQSLEYVNKKIEDKTFFSNQEFLNAIDHAKKNNSKLHLMGLISDGGVHSHINHLFALLDLIKEKEFNNVYLHLFLDGRDTPPKSALKYLDLLNKKLNELNIGKISTLSGRYYSMDRDNNFDRVEKAYDAIVNGIGREYLNYNECLNIQYEEDITDEFVMPSVLDKNGIIEDNDSIILYNFREDRLVELFSAITNKNYDFFNRPIRNNLYFVSMMHIGKTIVGNYAFMLDKIDNTLGVVIADNKLTQLRIAETEKYYHVTFFFDGCQNLDLEGCKKVLIPSPKVKTYDLLPEMSAKKITETLLHEVSSHKPDLIVLNYANGDMVGHTGVYDAGIKAVRVVDECLGKLYNKLKEDYILVITADHGNCEVMINDDNSINTAHTTNKVPLIITRNNLELDDGKLSNIAPTILELFNISKPTEMNESSLIRK